MAGDTRGRIKWASGFLIGLAVVFYLLKNVFHYSPLYINVLNDVLAVPVFLMVMAFLMKRLYGSRFQMSWLHVAATVATISILSEVIFPMINPHCTSDVVDVFLYSGGGIVYYLFTSSSRLQVRT